MSVVVTSQLVHSVNREWSLHANMGFSVCVCVCVGLLTRDYWQLNLQTDVYLTAIWSPWEYGDCTQRGHSTYNNCTVDNTTKV